MAELEKLFDGSYNYLDKGVHYSQENFSVVKNPDRNVIIFQSEILSRVSTGEFLKINVTYEVNSYWAPQKVVIQKSLGPNTATEIFQADNESQMLNYEFTNNSGTHKSSKNIVTRYQIATPAICCSMISSMIKKLDSHSRSSSILVTSQNNWEYIAPIIDQSIFMEYKVHEQAELSINGQSLSAVKCLVFQHDVLERAEDELPTTFYLSKHIGIPYQVEHGDLLIQIRYLNKNKTKSFEDFFR
jgi:hypothetical protein